MTPEDITAENHAGPVPQVVIPHYVCHKRVQALKISAIEFEQDGLAKIAPEDNGFGTFQTQPGFRERFKGSEGDLGYYVVYQDGYESWSPTKAFEEGYAQPARHQGPMREYDFDAADINKRFMYHPPKEEQPARYTFLRAEGKLLAKSICAMTPKSREQSVALTKLEEAIMWANAAIARNE